LALPGGGYARSAPENWKAERPFEAQSKRPGGIVSQIRKGEDAVTRNCSKKRRFSCETGKKGVFIG
jgi:hypothetical protein